MGYSTREAGAVSVPAVWGVREAAASYPFDFPPDLEELEELGNEIAILSANIHAATHQLLVLIALFDRREGWKADGHRSCAHWLAFRTGIDLGAARQKVRVARALEKLPETSHAMARGELSFSKARALTRIATPEIEEELLDFARANTAAQVEKLARGWLDLNRADEAEREKRRHASRFFSVLPDEHGMYLVRGKLDPEVGIAVMRAIEAATDALFRKGGSSPLEPESTSEQRRADALGLLAERALEAGFGESEEDKGDEEWEEDDDEWRDEEDAEEGEDEGWEDGTDGEEPSASRPGESRRVGEAKHGSAEPSPGDVGEAEGRGTTSVKCRQEHASGRPRKDGSAAEGAAGSGAGRGGPPARVSGTRASRVRIVLFVDPPTLDPAREPGRSHAEDGTRVAAETARRLCCDASIVPVRRGADGQVLDVGRSRRTIPPAIRRALEVRDGGCRFPGCGLRFTEGHHIQHWVEGGETKLSNLMLLCRFHHRAVHEDGFTVRFLPDGEAKFYSPEGFPLGDTPPCVLLEAGDPRIAIILSNRRRGIRPRAYTCSATYRSESEIPDELLFRTWEALDPS